MDNMTMIEKFEQRSVDELARELYIHKDIAPKQAFDMAQEFMDLQHNTDYRSIRTMSQTIQVRYTVERFTAVHGNDRIELHIACTDIKGFEVIHIRKGRNQLPSNLEELVEELARNQLDELLKKDGQRAGRINTREVSSFNGDF